MYFILQGWQKQVTLRKNFSLHKVAFIIINGLSNWGNELEKSVSSNNRQVDHKNAQFNVEEAVQL